MSQQVPRDNGGVIERLILPDPEEFVMPGVRWGFHCVLFTPAFWKAIWWIDVGREYCAYRIGETLEEEIAACLLGGYGIPSAVGLAAFYRVRDAGLLCGPPPSEADLYRVLAIPLELGARKIRYRFARQRSIYLSEALNRLHTSSPPTQDDLAFRNWLLQSRGIGPKTASWITRNWLDSDKVAIIDIHIARAGLLMGLYRQDESPGKHYLTMEQRFLDFAARIDVRPSILDALIWRQMKDAGRVALHPLKQS